VDWAREPRGQKAPGTDPEKIGVRGKSVPVVVVSGLVVMGFGRVQRWVEMADLTSLNRENPSQDARDVIA